MTLTSYAQNFEDVVLWRALGHVTKGCYVDIGANDPTLDSVSRAFYDAGWRGLHVEPVPSFANRLREQRADEPVVEAAVTDASGPILLYELSGLSSGRPDIAQQHEQSGHQARQMLAPTVGLDRLLEIMGPDVHWMKVDVEGMEADVLRSWGTSQVRPWVLVIESTHPQTQRLTVDTWVNEVTSRGYTDVLFDGLSTYFVHDAHSELASALRVPANVFDNFSITRDHFAAKGLSREFETIESQLDQVAQRAARAEETHEQLTARVSEMTAEMQRLHGEKQAEARARVDAEGELVESRIELARMEGRASQLHSATELAEQAIADLQRELTGANELIEAERNLSRSLADENLRMRTLFGQLQSTLLAAVTEPPDVWHRLGAWLRLTRKRSAWVGLMHQMLDAATERQPADAPASITEGHSRPMLNTAPGFVRNPYLRANSLAELVAWHDVDFVRCAYVTILGRQPDPTGETYYTSRLRAGVSKLILLAQLRTSLEGRRHDPGIAGLDRALRRARRSRMPIVGAFYRLLYRTEGDSAADRRQRAIENEIALLQSVANASADRLTSIAASLQRVEDRMQSLGRRVSEHAPTSDEPASDARWSREMLDPIDFKHSSKPEEALSILKNAINASREAIAIQENSRL